MGSLTFQTVERRKPPSRPRRTPLIEGQIQTPRGMAIPLVAKEHAGETTPTNRRVHRMASAETRALILSRNTANFSGGDGQHRQN